MYRAPAFYNGSVRPGDVVRRRRAVARYLGCGLVHLVAGIGNRMNIPGGEFGPPGHGFRGVDEIAGCSGKLL